MAVQGALHAHESLILLAMQQKCMAAVVATQVERGTNSEKANMS